MVGIRITQKDGPKPWAVNSLKGAVLNGLKVQRYLGRGSFGSVYRVLRHADSSQYALKTIETKRMSQRGRQTAVNEISLLAAVSHSFVIRFFDAFLHDEILCIVTEFAAGGDLAKHLLGEFSA
jgi:NIMA (never in mitosis gene a)-related kinase